MSASMFPARAGMSPGKQAAEEETDDVPRASGDEPQASAAVCVNSRCSPRERG